MIQEASEGQPEPELTAALEKVVTNTLSRGELWDTGYGPTSPASFGLRVKD